MGLSSKILAPSSKAAKVRPAGSNFTLQQKTAMRMLNSEHETHTTGTPMPQWQTQMQKYCGVKAMRCATSLSILFTRISLVG